MLAFAQTVANAFGSAERALDGAGRNLLQDLVQVFCRPPSAEQWQGAEQEVEALLAALEQAVPQVARSHARVSVHEMCDFGRDRDAQLRRRHAVIGIVVEVTSANQYELRRSVVSA